MSGLATREVIDNGQAFTLVDGVMVPQHIANDRKVDGAPAVVLHRLNETDIGQMIQTDNVQKGILLDPYFRFYDPKRGGVVGPVFNYFAAPQDTCFLDRSGKLATYNEDIHRIANLTDVCGHDGILLLNDAAIYDVAKNDPTKLASWHMPTLPLVNGCDIDGMKIEEGNIDVHKNNMCAHKRRGAFRNTFALAADTGTVARFYWTASEPRGAPWGMAIVRSGPCGVVVVDMAHGYQTCDHQDFLSLSSRPVRAEIRPS